MVDFSRFTVIQEIEVDNKYSILMIIIISIMNV